MKNNEHGEIAEKFASMYAKHYAQETYNASKRLYALLRSTRAIANAGRWGLRNDEDATAAVLALIPSIDKALLDVKDSVANFEMIINAKPENETQ